MKTDHWFYDIFRDCPWLFFRLMGLPESQAAEYRYDAVELKLTSLRLDGIFCPVQAGCDYYFLEAQLYPEADFYRNWLAKVVLYAHQKSIDVPWRGLVLFGTRSHEPTHFSGLEEWLASGRIQRVFLDELPEYPDVSLAVAVLKLAVTKRDDLIDKARSLAAAAKNAEHSETLLRIIEILLVTNVPQLSREEIQNMLQLNNIRQSRIFQEGLQEGREEGREEGRQEGRQEERRELTSVMIARLLSKGHSVKEVCDLLEVDEELVRLVQRSA